MIYKQTLEKTEALLIFPQQSTYQNIAEFIFTFVYCVLAQFINVFISY